MKKLLLGLGLGLVMGCVDDSTPPEYASMPGFRVRHQQLVAPCMVNVEGVGMIDIETEYLPGVVACENGGAPYEALKAQAVQARGFLYYKLVVEGATVIKNSQADQVYSCTGRLPDGPKDIHKQAVADTRGQYLEYNGVVIAPFYVAGNRPPNPDAADPITSCRGDGGEGDYGTEGIVTYNWGKAGCDIEMSSIGWTPDDCMRNPHNRGAASQNGEACLDRLGWKYQDMFDYYYGADIQLKSGEGQCGGPAPYVLTDFDRFCGAKDDSSYCFDAATRVDCVAEFGGDTEVCAGECLDGACVGGVDPGTESCAGLEDGLNCLDNVLLADCLDAEVVGTETCQNGCFEGACTELVSNNTNPNNNVGGPDNNNVGGPEIDPMGSPEGELPGLVDSSRGVTGGCSSTDTRPSVFAGLLVLGLIWWRRR